MHSCALIVRVIYLPPTHTHTHTHAHTHAHAHAHTSNTHTHTHTHTHLQTLLQLREAGIQLTRDFCDRSDKAEALIYRIAHAFFSEEHKLQ